MNYQNKTIAISADSLANGGAEKIACNLRGAEKGKERDSPLETPQRTQLCHHLDFDSLKTLIELPTHKPVRK